MSHDRHFLDHACNKIVELERGFVILFLIVCYETLNWLNYQKNNTKFSYPSFFFYLKLCNYFKIGFLFGFFVDAFKVGS